MLKQSLLFTLLFIFITKGLATLIFTVQQTFVIVRNIREHSLTYCGLAQGHQGGRPEVVPFDRTDWRRSEENPPVGQNLLVRFGSPAYIQVTCQHSSDQSILEGGSRGLNCCRPIGRTPPESFCRDSSADATWCRRMYSRITFSSRPTVVWGKP